MPSLRTFFPLFSITLLLALIEAAATSAEVVESISYEKYTVNHTPAHTLLQSINSASPIRENGKIYHGYTKWHIAWSFRWFAQPNGRCAITANKTRLDATITLPDLVSADSSAIKKFSNYISALNTHEMGHVQVGRKAAQQIDAQILALPAMESCTVLEKAANAIGYELLEKAREEERKYDLATEHGKTQRAWLPH